MALADARPTIARSRSQNRDACPALTIEPAGMSRFAAGCGCPNLRERRGARDTPGACERPQVGRGGSRWV